MRRAVFIDRDGTLNEEVGYVDAVDRFVLLPRSAEAIRRINGSALAAIVITNQSGVARGLFDEACVRSVNDAMERMLAVEGARIDGVYYCPHHPTEGAPPYRVRCDCRKPLAGLLQRAARELDLDLPASYVVGDSARDIEMASNGGATGILVLTGYGKEELERRIRPEGIRPAHVAGDLLDAVDWILEREGTP